MILYCQTGSFLRDGSLSLVGLLPYFGSLVKYWLAGVIWVLFAKVTRSYILVSLPVVWLVPLVWFLYLHVTRSLRLVLSDRLDSFQHSGSLRLTGSFPLQ
jgi:hypothetical protein